MLVLSISYIIRYDIQSCETGSGNEQKEKVTSFKFIVFSFLCTAQPVWPEDNEINSASQTKFLKISHKGNKIVQL